MYQERQIIVSIVNELYPEFPVYINELKKLIYTSRNWGYAYYQLY